MFGVLLLIQSQTPSGSVYSLLESDVYLTCPGGDEEANTLHLWIVPSNTMFVAYVRTAPDWLALVEVQRHHHRATLAMIAKPSNQQ